MKKHLAISFACHLAIALIVCFSASGSGGKKGHGRGSEDGDGDSQFKGAHIAGEVIPRERATEVTIVEAEPKGIKKKRKLKLHKDCPGLWYGGIGVETKWSAQGEVISKVYEGYPADAAGLRVGDLILHVDGNEIIGAPGTVLAITTLRGTYSITRGKICY